MGASISKVLRVVSVPTVFAVTLSGCTVMGMGKSDFTCDSEPQRCPSVAQAYADTHGNTMKPVEPRRSGVPQSSLAAPLPVAGPAIDESQWPKPVLEPAQVMRIWIAPWTDSKGTLIWPSYAFTEVRGRQWSYGSQGFESAKQLVPLQVERRKSVVGAEPTGKAK